MYSVRVYVCVCVCVVSVCAEIMDGESNFIRSIINSPVTNNDNHIKSPFSFRGIIIILQTVVAQCNSLGPMSVWFPAKAAQQAGLQRERNRETEVQRASASCL